MRIPGSADARFGLADSLMNEKCRRGERHVSGVRRRLTIAFVKFDFEEAGVGGNFFRRRSGLGEFRKANWD